MFRYALALMLSSLSLLSPALAESVLGLGLGSFGASRVHSSTPCLTGHSGRCSISRDLKVFNSRHGHQHTVYSTAVRIKCVCRISSVKTSRHVKQKPQRYFSTATKCIIYDLRVQVYCLSTFVSCFFAARGFHSIPTPCRWGYKAGAACLPAHDGSVVLSVSRQTLHQLTG